MDLNKPNKLSHPNRRRGDPGQGQQPERRDDLEARLSMVEKKLDANTALTQNVVDIFGTLEAGIKVLGALGTFAKWAAPIVALCVTVYALVTGKPPLDK